MPETTDGAAEKSEQLAAIDAELESATERLAETNDRVGSLLTRIDAADGDVVESRESEPAPPDTATPKETEAAEAEREPGENASN